MAEAQRSHEGIIYPPNLEYPDAWQLGESGPQGVLDYLKWIIHDEARVATAAERFRFSGVGFHTHTAAQRFDSAGNVIDKVELNFFSEEFPSTNEAQADEGGHAHARNMRLYSFYDPSARQTITRITMLPADAQRLPGVNTKRRDLAILNKVDTGDGLGTIYHPVSLGQRLTTDSVTVLPPLAYQYLPSTEIHEVQYKGDRAGVTVLRQGSVEPDTLNTPEGLMGYKGLTLAESVEVIHWRQQVGHPVVASTVLLREEGYDLDRMEERATPVPLDRFAYLVADSIHGIERNIRALAA